MATEDVDGEVGVGFGELVYELCGVRGVDGFPEGLSAVVGLLDCRGV